VFPLGAINLLQLIEGLSGEIETLPVNVLKVRSPADGRLLAQGAAMDTVDDPLEHAHVLAEAGPEEFTLLVLAEPVDVEDTRRGGEIALHAQPVTEVVAHMVAAEGKHRHGVAADFAYCPSGGSGGFAAHGGSDVDARRPVEGLVDKRHGCGSTTTEDEGRDGNAVGRLPRRINR